MRGQAGDIAWYLDDWSDEIMPCDATLEAWAEWLSKPDTEWQRYEAAAHGDTFAASRIRFEEDVVATRHGGGEWTLSRPIEGEPALLVCRFGFGMGWDAENILWWEGGATPEQAIRRWLAENADDCEDEEYFAVGRDEPSLTLVYRSDPPRLVPQETAA